MMRFLKLLGVSLLILTGISIRFPRAVHEFHMAITGDRFEVTPESERRFRAETLLEINAKRKAIALKSMAADTGLQEVLSKYLAGHLNPADIELQRVFEYLQDQFPGAQFLSLNICYSLTDQGIIENILDWKDVTDMEYESLNMVLFQEGRRLGCVAVLARRLPEFDVAAANTDGGRFFNRCPHCSEAHVVELSRKSRTIVLACPDCDQAYDVLAVDTAGRFYRANDFMLGFELPHVVGSTVEMGAPSEELLLHVWRTIVDHCEYENDNKRTSQREAWKTPDQTWIERSGDCEDTSILLADSLISAGIDARVAVGWNSAIGGHAWCVARIGDKQYLLESTIQHGKDIVLLTTAEAASDYRPGQLFDREQLYFRAKSETDQPIIDYWAPEDWNAVNRGSVTKITRVGN